MSGYWVLLCLRGSSNISSHLEGMRKLFLMIPRDDQYIYHNPKPAGASTSNHLHLPSPLQIEISDHYKPHKAPGFKMIVSLSVY